MVNKVMLVCRLGDDPVKKEFGTTSLCEMRVVTEKNRGNTKQTEWHNVKAFGELGKHLPTIPQKRENDFCIRGVV